MSAGVSRTMPLQGAIDEAKRRPSPGVRASTRRSRRSGQAAGRESELLVPADAELRYAMTQTCFSAPLHTVADTPVVIKSVVRGNVGPYEKCAMHDFPTKNDYGVGTIVRAPIESDG